MVVIKIFQQLFQFFFIMCPNKKNIINISKPYQRLKISCIKKTSFYFVHKYRNIRRSKFCTNGSPWFCPTLCHWFFGWVRPRVEWFFKNVQCFRKNLEFEKKSIFWTSPNLSSCRLHHPKYSFGFFHGKSLIYLPFSWCDKPRLMIELSNLTTL